MSSGLIKSISAGTLSTSIKGPPPLIEVVPRILKVFDLPGIASPVITKPGTVPCKAVPTFVTGRSPKASDIETIETAPVKFSFF